MEVTQIAAETLDDGVTFNTTAATTETIRDEDRH